jgi:hypothetical protein
MNKTPLPLPCTQGIMIFMAMKWAIPLNEWTRPFYTATIPQNTMLSCSKLDTTLLYSLQSGPKHMIIAQYHSAVMKIDEFLFSKSFHSRSVELHERLVNWDGCIDWMRTNIDCWLIRDNKLIWVYLYHAGFILLPQTHIDLMIEGQSHTNRLLSWFSSSVLELCDHYVFCILDSLLPLGEWLQILR